jgi:CarboxypepD_reg-like domain
MKKSIVCCTVFFLSAITFAQSSSFNISGKVIDAATKAPLQGASVFAQNTTMGTATDAAGVFSLWLNNGGYDLAISFTGYETYSKRITTADAADKNIVIELKQKEKALEEVAIKSSNEVKDGWVKYGDFFTENFIGKTSNSQRCVIKNKEALKFYFSKKRNRLKVMADVPVEIENPALGYTIKYTLDSFVYDYGSAATFFTGYPLFEEMQTPDAIQAATWHDARMKAYKGSILHFMRSVYNKNLQEEGFEIQFLVKNNTQDTAIQLENFYGALNFSKDDSTGIVEISPNQPEVAVLYKKEEPANEFLLQHEDAPKKFELSVINITPSQNIAIEQNGFYYDQNDMIATGYWAWEKAGDMLPYDFKPD